MPRKCPYSSKSRPLCEQEALRLRQRRLALKRDLFRFRHEQNETILAAAERDISRQRDKQRRDRMNEILRRHGQDEIPG